MHLKYTRGYSIQSFSHPAVTNFLPYELFFFNGIILIILVLSFSKTSQNLITMPITLTLLGSILSSALPFIYTIAHNTVPLIYHWNIKIPPRPSIIVLPFCIYIPIKCPRQQQQRQSLAAISAPFLPADGSSGGRPRP